MFVKFTPKAVDAGVAIVLFLHLFGVTAIAQVWRFLPGDSYFESELTQEFVMETQRSPADKPLALQYNVPSGLFDEYAGYQKLEIHSFSEKRRQLLATIYKQTRLWQPPVFEITLDKGREVRRELNGLHLLIYNKTFDYRLYSVGLRYNENWADDGNSFSVPRPFVSYYVLGDTLPNYVVEDWRSSKLVAPLKAVIPSFPGKTPFDLQFAPVVVQSKDVNCIVVVNRTLEDLRMGNARHGFFIVEDDRASKVYYAEGGWTVRELTEADSGAEPRN